MSRICLSQQRGVALPVATAMLLVISLFVTAFFSLALRTSDTANDDRSAKRALAAAEAGLQAATYRLNQIRPAIASGACLTGAAASPVGGECPGYEESLGNGASYRYYVTPALGATGACISLPSVAPATTDRCITSTGTVNGITRRVQARVGTTTGGIAVFAQGGLLGESLVYANNNVRIWSDVGSNQNVTFDQGIRVFDSSVPGEVRVAAGGSYNPSGPGIVVQGGVNTNAAPFTLPPVDFEPFDGDVPGENDNALLPNALFEGGAAGRAARRFHLEDAAPYLRAYTLQPGTYHFCNVFIGNNATLRVNNPPSGGTPTRIFVDHPSRPGSPCPANPVSGVFGGQRASINEDFNQRAELFQVYLYGSGQESTRPPHSWCGCSTADFAFNNEVDFYGIVYAPDSTVHANNNVNFWGAIAADRIRFRNTVQFRLTDAARDATVPAGTGGAVERKGWTECKPRPTVATDPESGC